ncbi:MAG TPA: hypothetical protein VGQ22_14985 [Steroidobacteraceae bacterium]|nr:hypothetical protein [Steroidobacteraceae bacterium]
MCFHDSSFASALSQLALEKRSGAPGSGEGRLDAVIVEMQFRRKQRVPVGMDLPGDALDVLLRLELKAGLRAVKLREHRPHSRQPRRRSCARGDGPIEHQRCRKATHADEPIYSRTLSAQVQRCVRTANQRHNVQIDIGGEPAIQAQLFSATQSPRIERAQIHARNVDRLLQFAGPLAGEKHPREMRFDRLDGCRMFRIDRNRPERLHFVFQATAPGIGVNHVSHALP